MFARNAEAHDAHDPVGAGRIGGLRLPVLNKGEQRHLNGRRCGRRCFQVLRLGCGQPMPFTGERVGGQRDAPRAGGARQRGPVDRDALGPHLRQPVELAGFHPRVQRRALVLLVAECRHGVLVIADAGRRQRVVTGEVAGEPVAQLPGGGNHERQAFLHRLAAGLQRPGDVGKPGIARLLGEHAVQVADLLGEPVAVLGRQHDQLGFAGAHRRPGLRHVLLDDQVRDGAVRAEGGNPGDARRSPGGEVLLHAKRRGGEVDVRVQLAGMQRRRDHAVLHLQQHLGERNDSRRAFQVTHVGFDRPDGAVLAPVGVRAERPGEPVDLDGVAERGSGAVALDVADVLSGDPGVGERCRDHLALRQRVGHGHAVGLAAVVGGHAADHAVDVVPVGDRGVHRFEQHAADTLAGHVAAATRAERAAPPIGGEEVHLAQRHILVRVQRQVRAAREGHGGAAAADRLDGHRDGVQR